MQSCLLCLLYISWHDGSKYCAKYHVHSYLCAVATASCVVVLKGDANSDEASVFRTKYFPRFSFFYIKNIVFARK